MQFKMLSFHLTSIIATSTLLVTSGCSSNSFKENETPYGELPSAPYKYLRARSTIEQEDINASVKESQTNTTSPSHRQILIRAEEVFRKSLISRDEKTFSSALLALAMCHHPVAADIVGQYVLSESPFLQLASIQALSYLGTEKAISLIHETLKSPYPIVRMEAIWMLIDAQEKGVLNQVFALSDKLPSELFVFLPELYAKDGSPQAIERLQKMAYEENDRVVCQVFLSIYKYRLVSCEQFVLSYSSHSPVVLEAQAAALELFQSSEALNKLRILSNHSNPFVRMRAIASRVSLGDMEAITIAENEYQSGNRTILAALLASQGQASQTKIKCPIVLEEDTSQDITPILYLLSCRDEVVLPYLRKLISPHTGETPVFTPSASPGGTIVCWKKQEAINPLIPLHEQLYIKEQSLELQEGMLTLASTSLNEEATITLLRGIATEKRVDLYPRLFFLLQELPYDKFRLFCEEFRDMPGSPYLRAYLSLAEMKRSRHFNETLMKKCFETARKETHPKESWRIPLPFIVNDLPQQFQNNESDPPLETGPRLYLLACQLSVELAQERSIALMYNELQNAPPELAPFIAAALLEASL